MEWTEEEKRRLMQVARSQPWVCDATSAVASAAVELVAARGGVTEDVATALSGVPAGPGGDAERAAVQRLYERVATLRLLLETEQAEKSARVAVLEAENQRLRAQGQADYRALHDALGWAHTDHGKPLPPPWRAVTTIISDLAEARATIARLTAAGQALSEHADKAGPPAPGRCENPDPTTGPTCAERGCGGQTCQYPKVKSGCDCAVKNIACIHWAARVRAPETP